jgi:nitronate monooxygenase
MWPNTRLLELLGIEQPIVLAPMAGFATPELAAAVAAAGGLGSIGCAAMSPVQAREAIERLRALSARPINVNFFCHAPVRSNIDLERPWRERLAPFYHEFGLDPGAVPLGTAMAPFGDAMCAVVEATRPEVASFHFGLPQQGLLARVKAAGSRVMSSATTIEEARWLEANGADIIIAQGAEAGGHRGIFLTDSIAREVASQPGTMALVPQIVDAVGVPVVAAGAIGDARGIAAAFALGAAGVQIGTGYLLCPEAGTPPLHRAALREARADATSVTNVFTGRPARSLVNRLVREVGPLSEAAPDFPLASAAMQPLRAAAERTGSPDFTPLWSGQAAPLARAIPAEALTRALAAEALSLFQRMAR